MGARGALTIDRKPLRDRVTVIAGACYGYGLAAAYEVASAGARVILAGTCGLVAEIASEIRASGGEAIPCVADIATLDGAQAIARVALEECGRVDAWVNVVERGPSPCDAASTELDEIASAARRHCGVVNGSLVALWNMREAGGTIVTVCRDVPFASGVRAAAHFTGTLQQSVRREGLAVDISLLEGIRRPPQDVARELVGRMVGSTRARLVSGRWSRRVA